MKTSGIHSCYLEQCFNLQDVRKMVRTLAIRLKPHRKNFDAIACQGWSGALIAPILALRLNKPMIVVRKPGENPHSTYKVEGYLQSTRYVIVDDFVRTGNTVRRIMSEIYEEQQRIRYYPVPQPSSCYGLALYACSSPARFTSNGVGLPHVWTTRDEWHREEQS
jgi:orotate phosphoribosyltransferase